jgi:hypothetical protein
MDEMLDFDERREHASLLTHQTTLRRSRVCRGRPRRRPAGAKGFESPHPGHAPAATRQSLAPPARTADVAAGQPPGW